MNWSRVMTENEAREYLLNRYLVVDAPENPPKEECEKHNAVLDVAIKALNRVQEYEAIGTVEECRVAKRLHDKLLEQAKEAFKDSEEKEKEFRERLKFTF